MKIHDRLRGWDRLRGARRVHLFLHILGEHGARMQNRAGKRHVSGLLRNIAGLHPQAKSFLELAEGFLLRDRLEERSLKLLKPELDAFGPCRRVVGRVAN